MPIFDLLLLKHPQPLLLTLSVSSFLFSLFCRNTYIMSRAVRLDLNWSIVLHVLPLKDEEKESSHIPGSAQTNREAVITQHQHHPLSLLPASCYEDDPQAILDAHLSRVLKTPGCQSPGMGRHSPRARSPDCLPGGKLLLAPGTTSIPTACALVGKRVITKQNTKHVHHHYIHHHTIPKSKEQIEAEAAQRVQCLCAGGNDYYCYTKCKGHAKGADLPVAQLEPFGWVFFCFPLFSSDFCNEVAGVSVV